MELEDKLVEFSKYLNMLGGRDIVLHRPDFEKDVDYLAVEVSFSKKVEMRIDSLERELNKGIGPENGIYGNLKFIGYETIGDKIRYFAEIVVSPPQGVRLNYRELEEHTLRALHSIIRGLKRIRKTKKF